MYLASLFTSRGVLRYFGGLVKTAREDERRHFEIFLFRATSAVLALDQMNFRIKHCLADAQTFRKNLTIKRPQVAFWAPDLFLLFHEFTPFLSAMRFLQDMLLPLIVRRLNLRISVPQSLNDAMKDLSVYGLPPPIEKLLGAYWNESGADVRKYRVLDQHYFILCRHTFLEFEPKPRLVVYLPDDPSIQTESKVTFERKIDAVPYFADAFNAWHKCTELISKEMGAEPSVLQEEMSMEHIGTLDAGVKQTLALWLDAAGASSALEIGQTEERRVYIQKIAVK